MKEFRAAIIRMHERGTGKREIGRLLGIDESTVRKAIKRFEETGSNDNRKREKTARSSRNIQRSKGMIKRNATTKVNSTRKLAKKLGVSQESARQILRTDLNLKPYKLQKRQKLSAAARLKEKACSKPHPNLESLKKALKKAWKEITLETLIKTVDDFPKRLEACIAANGGYFE